MKSKTVATLALSCAVVCILAIGLCFWAFWSMTGTSTQGGTRLVYSVDFEKTSEYLSRTGQRQAPPAEILEAIRKRLQVKVDPSAPLFGTGDLGARFVVVDDHRVAIELPPSEDGSGTDPELIATVREWVETPVDFELYIGAEGHPDVDEADLLVERERVSSWLTANPDSTLKDFNALEPEAGGPTGLLRWFPRRLRNEGVDSDIPLQARLVPLLRQTGPARFSVEDIDDVQLSQDYYGYPALEISVNPDREVDFGDMTEANLERGLAIVLFGEVVTLATIKARLPAKFLIEGGLDRFTREEVRTYARLLRAADLPPLLEFDSLEFIEEPLR